MKLRRIWACVLLVVQLTHGSAFAAEQQLSELAPCGSGLLVDPALPLAAEQALGGVVAQAEALLLVDRTSGVALVERNADSQRAVASAVKILTALTVISHADLNAPVQVSQAAARMPGATIDLTAGQTYPVRVLLAGLLVRSGNDAAVALAEHVGGTQDAFVGLMRDEATRLGLATAVIEDPSGLSNANRLSARQLAALADVALANPVLARYMAAPAFRLGQGPVMPNRNLLIASYPGATGVKTGFTSLAGYALVASAVRDGRELIAVVLSADSDPVRFRRAEQLLTFGFSRIAVDALPSQMSWVTPSGETTWQFPDTQLVGFAGGVSVALQLPRTPAERLTIELWRNQRRVCGWESWPETDRTTRPTSVGAVIRGTVSHAYGTVLRSETSGSLRTLPQGGRS